MTLRLRPPAPLHVECRTDGQPVRVRRGGRVRTITRIAAIWIRPAAWWSESGTGSADSAALTGERTYYRLVLDGMLVYEAFSTDGRWYLERIID